MTFSNKTKELIDDLKGICAAYGLGNDGNEFKIITQAFLYKFMNDKFAFEIKNKDKKLANSKNWEEEIASYSDDEYSILLMRLNPESGKLKREHYLSHLHKNQNKDNFSKLFDDTLRDISIFNIDIFSVQTDAGSKIKLFDELSHFITDASKRDEFCRAIINQLVNFSFEDVFNQKFDFFSTIFEYLIKDYNKDGGGNYAEYYTPHAVSKIIASILIDSPVNSVTCYDPSAGSGTLLMNLAHSIGEEKCSIYSQDISQKSSGMLRLNLILNNLVHSIQNIIQGNTLLSPYHRVNGELMKFDFIVSNPPFKLDFSDERSQLNSKENEHRFFAGVPTIPKKDKDKMAIYLLFMQHIIYSLKKDGKAAIVVPTGFLSAKGGIEKKIKEKIINEKILKGVITLPGNLFATTPTAVSVIFLDRSNAAGNVLLMNGSDLGTTEKDGKNKKTVLNHDDETLIVNAFRNNAEIEDLSVLTNIDEIKAKAYSLNPGQYFDLKVEYSELSTIEFENSIETFKGELQDLFLESKSLEDEIKKQLSSIKYDK